MSLFKPFPTLTTAKLSLRELGIKDQKKVLELRSHPKVNHFIKRNPPSTLTDAIEFIQRIRSEKDKSKSVLWVISQKDSPNFLGTACLWNISTDNKKAELGYELFPQYHNQGIMSEAIQAVLEYAFSKLKLDQIEAYTHFNNKSSIHLLENFKFKKNEIKSDPENTNNRIYYLNSTHWKHNNGL